MRNRLIHRFIFQCAFLPALAIAGGDAPPAIVQIEAAANIEIAPFTWVTGTVIGRYDAKIAAEVEGILQTVLEAGDRVQENELIAKVDDATYRLVLNEIEAEAQPIETMVGFFQRESLRLARLAKQNNAAKNQLDQTQASRDEALAKIRVVKAKLAMAHDDLNKTTVRAPFAGVVTERYKSPGERVDVGDHIIRLIDTQRVEAQAHISQASFLYVKNGTKVRIRDTADVDVDGIVRTVIPVGDDISRLYEIRVEFQHSHWPVGTAVEIAVPTSAVQNVIAVPRDALVIRQSGIIVYRINANNLAEVVPVTTGVANTTHIQIIGDVRANDKIVVRGNERLRPGQTVQIIGGSSS